MNMYKLIIPLFILFLFAFPSQPFAADGSFLLTVHDMDDRVRFDVSYSNTAARFEDIRFCDEQNERAYEALISAVADYFDDETAQFVRGNFDFNEILNSDNRIKQIGDYFFFISWFADYGIISRFALTVTREYPITAQGDYFHTDIVTYLWDVPINSINIGGATFIDAEAMVNYSFIVDRRTTTEFSEEFGPRTTIHIREDAGRRTVDADADIPSRYPSGTIHTAAGQYYNTYINVFFYHQPITAYTVNGRIFISAEELREHGYTVDWCGDTRTLRINYPPLVIDFPHFMEFMRVEDFPPHFAQIGTNYTNCRPILYTPHYHITHIPEYNWMLGYNFTKTEAPDRVVFEIRGRFGGSFRTIINAVDAYLGAEAAQFVRDNFWGAPPYQLIEHGDFAYFRGQGNAGVWITLTYLREPVTVLGEARSHAGEVRLNGVPVNSVSIGGKLFIDADSLTHYGFAVFPRHQTYGALDIVDTRSNETSLKAQNGSLLDMRVTPAGSVAAFSMFPVYHTVTLNGTHIASHNVNGRTFIDAEAMQNHGYTVVWSSDNLLVTRPPVIINYPHHRLHMEISDFPADFNSPYTNYESLPIFVPPADINNIPEHHVFLYNYILIKTEHTHMTTFTVRSHDIGADTAVRTVHAINTLMNAIEAYFDESHRYVGNNVPIYVVPFVRNTIYPLQAIDAQPGWGWLSWNALYQVETVGVWLDISISIIHNQPFEAIGYYYYTDIITYINDVPVNSINIGGVTLIDAESLRHYGFEVTWHEWERHLEIVDNHLFDNYRLWENTRSMTPEALNGLLLDMRDGAAGAIAGEYYFTQIQTTLNGARIPAHNIGGRTFIGAEAMRGWGYSVLWNAEDKTLRIR
jgi:hypothetical protein